MTRGANHGLPLDARRGSPRRLRDALSRRKVPETFICPISCEIMSEPVLAADGHVYERVCALAAS